MAAGEGEDEMNNLTSGQVESAANWWADRVCAPVFDGLSDEERKDPSSKSYEHSEMLASLLVVDVKESTRDKFIDALKNILSDDDFGPRGGLHVDYHPDGNLAKAAKTAGIPGTNFPWKTNMWFTDDGRVKAGCGYGSAIEYID